MTEANNNISINELIQKSLDGELSENESQILNEFVSNPNHVPYYLRCLRLHCALKDKTYLFTIPKNISNAAENLSLEELALCERYAPAIEIPKTKPVPKKNTIQIQTSQKINKVTLVTAILSAAAMLLLGVLLYIDSQKDYRLEVATLVDQMNVKWTETGFSMKNGRRIFNNDYPFHLEEGIVKFEYDIGVEVLVEGPASFSIERHGLFLNFGRIYSKVSEKGLGFTIKTPTAQFVDHGTEFGIHADLDGSAELHVIKGKVQLLADTKKSSNISELVTENHAVRYDNRKGTAERKSIEQTIFARDLDSEKGIIWRGHTRIDLADIVGGGNGFGTGTLEVGIDPLTGRRGGYRSEVREGNGQYVTISNDRYIDGVFVPCSDLPQQVTSDGHFFAEFFVTRPSFYIEITNGSGRLCEEVKTRNYGVTLNNQQYGTLENPAITMHTNIGITFDLDKIRSDFSKMQISLSRFTAQAGLSTVGPWSGHADIWVLVDGQIRSHLKDLRENNRGYSIDCELHETDRFLTLMTTDAGDPEMVDGRHSTNSDWCVFVKPELILVSSD